jgi:hypothetical protein
MSGAGAAESLRKFSSRDFLAWRGLAPGISLADVAAVSDADLGQRSRGTLGDSHQPAEWIPAAFREYDTGARVWVSAGEDRVVLIDVESSNAVVDLGTLLRKLGPPEAELDSYLGTFKLARSEWVFASRGLTLYIEPETRKLLRLAVYVPASLDEYRRTLRLNLEMRRLPARRRGTEYP